MLRRLLVRYSDDRRPLIGLIVLGLVTAAAEAASLVALAPLLQAVAEEADEYVGGPGPFEFRLSLAELSLIASALVTVAFLLTFLGSYVAARVTGSHLVRRRVHFVETCLSSSWEAQTATRDGRLVSFGMEFVGQSAQGLTDLALAMRSLTGLAVFVGGAMTVSWEATTVVVAAAGVIFALQRPIRNRSRRLARESGQLNVSLTEEITMIAQASRDIAAYAVDDAAADRFRQAAEAHRRVRVRAQLATSLLSPVARTAAVLVILALIAYAASAGQTEVGALGVVVLLLYRSLTYAQSLVTIHAKLVMLEPILDQLQTEFEHYSSAFREAGSLAPTDARQLSLRSTGYRYPGDANAAVHDVSFTVGKGEVLGLVGPSGAGKSTIADLLIGLRTPSEGAVLIDGQPVSALSRAGLASLVAAVAQTPTIVPGTLADNIRFFRTIEDAALTAAIKSVGLSPMVDALPHGLDTRIGSGARAVSGGQAQRIGIARALADDPSFLILDEPTSALDPGSERVITEMIGTLRGRVGIIVIAHRLSTLRYCDRIAVIEDGRLTGDGSLAQLSAENPYFQQAVELGSLDWAQQPASTPLAQPNRQLPDGWQ